MVLAAGAALGVFVGSDLASAQTRHLRCGDTVTRDTVLRRDLVCRGTLGLTVEGPATLDLGGHRVDCSDSSAACINLVGNQARLDSGRVIALASPVLVAGNGGHTVRDVRSSSLETVSFDVLSDSNHLERNEGFAENAAPFSVTGNTNVLDGNISPGVTHTAHFGIGGAGNFLTRNSGSGEAGIAGILLGEGADSTTVLANVLAPGQFNGIAVHSDRNLIVANVASGLQEDGIRLEAGAESNVVLGNQARGNGGFDLSDANQDCDANQWVANQFDDVNQACAAFNLGANQ
jgi:hypothetical protein